jgi:hypothetical protein
MRQPQTDVNLGIVVRNYDELRQFVRSFADGRYDTLIVVGEPRIGKSEIFKQVMQEVCGLAWGLVTGKQTPVCLYATLYKHRYYPVVLDDLDGLLNKPDNLSLLKCVCDNQPVKTVAWASTHVVFQRQDNPLPQRFDSISRVAILCNRLPALHADFRAVAQRGMLVHFQPTAVEVHAEVGRAGWFDDEEVYRFVGRNLHLIDRPSFSYYLAGRDLKLGGMDWRNKLLRMILGEARADMVDVAEILTDTSFDQCRSPGRAREEAFIRRGGSRATYYRRKKEFEKRRGKLDAPEIDRTPFLPRPVDPRMAEMLQRRQQMELEGQAALNPLAEEEDDQGEVLPSAAAPAVRPAEQLAARLRRLIADAVLQGDHDAANRLYDALQRITSAGNDASAHGQQLTGDVL